MHPYDKLPTRPGFEQGTSSFEPSRPAIKHENITVLYSYITGMTMRYSPWS